MIFMVAMVALMMALLPLAFAKGPAAPIPTCTITKGGKKLIANISDLKQWEKDGWSRSGSPPSVQASDADEGNYTLREAIEKCRSKASLEEIVESNGIDVELDGLSFAEQKEAVLDAIAEDES